MLHTQTGIKHDLLLYLPLQRVLEQQRVPVTLLYFWLPARPPKAAALSAASAMLAAAAAAAAAACAPSSSNSSPATDTPYTNSTLGFSANSFLAVVSNRCLQRMM
jgi:hypothetical protein